MIEPCPVCGRIFEPTIDLNDGTVLAGHIPGGPLCTPRAKIKPTSRITVVKPALTPEERQRKIDDYEAAIAAKQDKEGT